jgi:hypothetical protein
MQRLHGELLTSQLVVASKHQRVRVGPDRSANHVVTWRLWQLEALHNLRTYLKTAIFLTVFNTADSHRSSPLKIGDCIRRQKPSAEHARKT